MENTLKINELDLVKIKELGQEKENLNSQLVRIGWAEIDLNLGKKNAEEKALELSTKEKSIFDDLAERYGEFASLDINTGEYTLVPKESEVPLVETEEVK